MAEGGYGCDFVHLPPSTLICPICLLPFRDPHLLSCCGAKYCESCIDRVKAASKPCPLCKQPFSTMLDRNEQRNVLGLKVRCSRKKNGCEWEGELRHLEKHEREECGRAFVQCRYHCGGRFPRCWLREHERDECSQRPVDVKLESSMRKMEELTEHVEQLEQSLKDMRGELSV